MISIHPSAIIAQNVEIEDDVYIGAMCLIGFPAEWKGREHESKGVIIRSGARLTGLVTVDAGVERPTVIGNDCYLMKHSHVGHDTILSKGVVISCGAKIGGHSLIGQHSNIGLNSVIHQKQIIAEGVMIGMGSVVTKKLITEPFKTYAGNPAKLIGENDKHPEYLINMKQFI